MFAQQYTNYSTKEGLPSNHIYTIVQDVKGFVWFLTDKGMARYNGKEFKTFTTKNGLPINDVWDAYPTPDGKVWYMSKTPRLGYIKNDTVLSFPNSNTGKIINPTYSSQIGDSVYPTGPTTSFYFNENKWVRQLNRKTNVLEDEWITIRQSEVGYLSFKSDGFITLFSNDIKKIAKVKISEVYGKIGTRGQLNDSLFFWTTNSNYSILNLNTKKINQFRYKDYIGIDKIKHPRINVVGDQIQISGTHFVAKLNKKLEIVDPFFYPKDLASHFGIIDKLNTVWLATFNNGVYALPYVKRNITYAFKKDKIQSFDVINNNLIVGVYKKGFYKYNATNTSFKPIIDTDDYVYGASHIKEIDAVFFSLRNEIVKRVKEKNIKIDLGKVLNYKLLMNEVGRKFIYFNNKIYSNFSFGLNKINSETLKIEKEFKQKGCNDIFKFKNRFLIATTNGLLEFKNDSISPVVYKNEVFNKSILSLKAIDNKNLLINTDGFGAYITNLETIKPLKGTEFLIVEDAFVKANSIWLATNSGVLQFVKNKDSFKLKKHITVNDGLPTKLIKKIYVDANNIIVGTNKGVVVLPKNIESKSQLLDVYFDESTYNNEKITESNNVFKYKKNNSLNVTISSIDFSPNGNDLSYIYRLEPIQKECTATTINNFSFNNLQPDTYKLHIEANAIKKELSFTIQPLWWQTLWFKIIALILSVLLVVIISRFFAKRSQIKKTKKIFEDKRLSELQLKALRSQMNPHFVFNSLSAIQYYIGENDFEASEMYLVKFSKLIRQFFELSKENEITLATEVSLLKNYLEIEKLRFKEKLSFKINVDNTLDTENIKIPTMLLQPIVENAVNHGVFNKLENGLVTLNFKPVNSKTFKVEIIDDGVGFANTKNRQSKNIKSSNVLKDRLHFLNYSQKWEISYTTQEFNSEIKDKGNKSIFIIKHKNHE